MFRCRCCRSCELLIFPAVTSNRGHSSTEHVTILRSDSPQRTLYDDFLSGINGRFSFNNEIRIFVFEHVRYVLDYRTEQFIRIWNLDETLTTNELIQCAHNGISDAQRNEL